MVYVLFELALTMRLAIKNDQRIIVDIIFNDGNVDL